MSFHNLLSYYWRLHTGKEYRFASSLESIKQSLPNDVEIIDAVKVKRAFSEYTFSDNHSAKLQYAEEVDSYKAIFRNVSCFANSDILLFRNNEIYCEVKTFKHFRNIASCEDGYVLMEDKHLWHRNEIPEESAEIEKGIFLTGIYSWNYYHFFYAVMGRILRTYDIPTDVPLLVDESCGFVSTYRQILELCNKQHRRIIYLKNKVKYNVKELYYISSPLIIVPNVMSGVVYKPEYALYDVDAVRALRKELLPYKDHSRKYPKRIFISRKNASDRRKFNENECILFLKQYGFEVVYPETMSFVEQMALFSSAETIVAGSGAAFTNLLFCPKGCNIIIIIGYHFHLSFWQTLSCINELNLYEINDPKKGFLTKKNKPYDLHSDFVIDIKELKALIEQFGYKQSFSYPDVTVSVMTYNSEKYVRETLESIKEQSYPNIVLQICDDCSTDNTLSICKGWILMYGDRFVKTKIIESEKNTGISANCNRAWDNCETEYCKVIAGDDVLLPNCLQSNMLYASEHPDAKMIFSKMEVLPYKENASKEEKEARKRYEKSIDYSIFSLREDEQAELLQQENHLLAPPLFVNVKALKAIGLRHDERIPDVEDYPMWLNAIKLGIKFHFFDIPTVGYRFHKDSISNSASSKWRYERNLRLIMELYGGQQTTGKKNGQKGGSKNTPILEKQLKNLTKKNKKHLKLLQRMVVVSITLLFFLIIAVISLLIG